MVHYYFPCVLCVLHLPRIPQDCRVLYVLHIFYVLYSVSVHRVLCVAPILRVLLPTLYWLRVSDPMVPLQCKTRGHHCSLYTLSRNQLSFGGRGVAILAAAVCGAVTSR